MSRARAIRFPNGEEHWYDTKRDGEPASALQVELLATYTDADIDDILDEVVSQADVVKRLREALGQAPIPREVIERRQKWRQERQRQPQCRCCGKIGDSTKHHFVNKWILRELEYYQQRWAERTKNCIPLCIECHRKFHAREENGYKSITDYLKGEEKQFAQEAIRALLHEKPKLFELILDGDPRVSYESRLILDWCERKFRVEVVDEPQPVIAQAA